MMIMMKTVIMMMIDDHDDNNFDFDNDEVWLGWSEIILPLIISIIMIMRMQTLMMTMNMLNYDDHIIISLYHHHT